MQTLKDMYDWLNPQNSIPPALMTALQRALDAQGSEASDEPSIRVAWTNLLDRPIANTPDKSVGIQGDLIVADAQSLMSAPASDFTSDAHGNLGITSSGSARTKIMDFGTRQAWLNHLVINDKLTMGATSNVQLHASLPTFKLHNWCFDSLALSNSSAPLAKLEFVGPESTVLTCKLVVTNTIAASNGITAPHIATACNTTGTLAASNIVCGSFLFTSDSNASIKLSDNNCAIKHESASNSVKSVFEYSPGALTFKTKQGNLSEVLQFSTDSNGTLFCRSNLAFPLTTSIRAETSTNTGILRMTPDTLRFLTESSNAVERINMSYNSNGLFLLKKASIYGSLESTEAINPVDPLSNILKPGFARLDMTLSNGLVYGWGLSNDPLSYTSCDMFKVSREGELYTRDKRSGLIMCMHVNNCAEIVSGNGFKVDVEGGLTTSNVVIRNLVGFNVNASNLQEQGQSLYLRYASVSNHQWASNTATWASNVATFGSNALSNQTPSSTHTAFSNWVSPLAISASNTASWASNVGAWGSNSMSNFAGLATTATASWASNVGAWGSNSLSNFASLATTATASWASNVGAWGSNSQSNFASVATTSTANWASNVAAFGSKALSNSASATHTHPDRYWGFSNAAVVTTSNVRCGSFEASNISIPFGSAVSVTSNMAQRNIVSTDREYGNDRTYVWAPGSYTTPLLTLTSDGRVEVNIKVPEAALHVFGGHGIIEELGRVSLTLKSFNPSADADLPCEVVFDHSDIFIPLQKAAVGVDRPGRNFFVWVNGQDRLNITTSGLVGVGTASPSYLLDVTGTLRS